MESITLNTVKKFYPLKKYFKIISKLSVFKKREVNQNLKLNLFFGKLPVLPRNTLHFMKKVYTRG